MITCMIIILICTIAIMHNDNNMHNNNKDDMHDNDVNMHNSNSA